MTNARNTTRRRLFKALPLITVGALLFTGCGNNPESAAHGKTQTKAAGLLGDNVLHVSTITTDAPFALKSGSDLVGFVPDLSQALAEELGVDVAYVETPFPGLVPSIESGKSDVVISPLADTPEGEKTLDFVPYIRTSRTFLVPEGNPKNISLETLCGTHAATVRGGVLAPFLEKRKQQCASDGEAAMQLSLYDDSASAFTQLRAGKIDSFMSVTAPARHVAANSDGFDVLDETYLGGIYGIALPKGNEELVDEIRRALIALIQDGTYQGLLEKHGMKEDGLTEEEIIVNGVGTGALE
jgi:polar amino acid transport system substrate-binding protein